MVVLDTCALIALCSEPGLSTTIIKKIEQGAIILSVSFAEIACRIKLNKLLMNISVDELYIYLKQTDNLQIIDIGVTEWLDSINLDWPNIRDPADRLIVAFAKKNHLPIITSDQQIKKFYKKVFW